MEWECINKQSLNMKFDSYLMALLQHLRPPDLIIRMYPIALPEQENIKRAHFHCYKSNEHYNCNSTDWIYSCVVFYQMSILGHQVQKCAYSHLIICGCTVTRQEKHNAARSYHGFTSLHCWPMMSFSCKYRK